jgi:hypothetical protein
MECTEIAGCSAIKTSFTQLQNAKAWNFPVPVGYKTRILEVGNAWAEEFLMVGHIGIISGVF